MLLWAIQIGGISSAYSSAHCTLDQHDVSPAVEATVHCHDCRLGIPTGTSLGIASSKNSLDVQYRTMKLRILLRQETITFLKELLSEAIAAKPKEYNLTLAREFYFLPET